MSPVDKAIRLYRINAIIAFVLTAIVVGVGLLTRNVLGILLCLLVAAVPFFPGLAALAVIKGLRTGNADPVTRGTAAIRRLGYFTMLGIVSGLATSVRLLLDEPVDTATLIGVLVVVGLLSGLVALIRHSLRVLENPQIQERLGLQPKPETQAN